MPRDRKTIHRATSDVEDEILSDEEPHEEPHDQKKGVEVEKIPSNLEDNLEDERKKFLKNAILKRTLALKQQRERNRQQKVGSTQKY